MLEVELLKNGKTDFSNILCIYLKSIRIRLKEYFILLRYQGVYPKKKTFFVVCCWVFWSSEDVLLCETGFLYQYNCFITRINMVYIYFSCFIIRINIVSIWTNWLQKQFSFFSWINCVFAKSNKLHQNRFIVGDNFWKKKCC